ncbi:RNA polymerase sigma factor (plasmid) [Kitasatospora griseola]|uniref:RNA polymerase sigma factor n=1 Tax=Kitasatospora griseola TaxID=2064 RepID=UPI00385605CA
MTEDASTKDAAREPETYSGFPDFVDKTRSALWSVALYESRGDHHVAEDILQDAHLRLFRSWGRISNQDGSLKAYARVAVRNAAKSFYKRHSRLVTVDLPAGDQPAASWDGAIPHADATDIGALVVELIDQLPPQQRTVVTLVYIEDKTRDETAAEMGRKPDTVRRYLDAAIKRLQKQIIETGLEAKG